jgi:hypothetical protein
MRFLKQKKGMNANSIAVTLVGLFVVITLVIALLPSVKSSITASVGNWTASEYALLVIIPTIAIIGICLALIMSFLKKTR